MSKATSAKGDALSFGPCMATSFKTMLSKAFPEVPATGTDPRHKDFSREGYLLWSLLSKLPTASVPATLRKQRALERFLSNDSKNARSNARLLYMEGFIHGIPVKSLFDKAREICSQIVGDITVQDVVDRGTFSGGASTSKRRVDASAYHKYREKSDITVGALPYLDVYLKDTVLETMLLERPGDPYRVVESNIFFTVPKNAETDRGACKEPDWNMFFQLGVGSYLKQRLKRVGIDLFDQRPNQVLAQIGSRDGSLATLDLSSASDLNSYALIERVLPFNLFKICCDLRCETTILPDGSVYEPNMFSSMGNGFTFEVETLVFYSLARSLAYHKGIRGRISVFGDDIIVPTALAPSLVDLLGYAGHIPNMEKSFWHGFFRESCGKHYFHGQCVTPFYVRQPIVYGVSVDVWFKNRRGKMAKQSLRDSRRFIHFHNRLLNWASVGDMLDPRCQALLDHVRSYVHRALWGGYDVESIDSLVYDCPPRMRWLVIDKTRHHEDATAYMMALAGHRTENSIQMVEGKPRNNVTEAPGLISLSTSLLVLKAHKPRDQDSLTRRKTSKNIW